MKPSNIFTARRELPPLLPLREPPGSAQLLFLRVAGDHCFGGDIREPGWWGWKHPSILGLKTGGFIAFPETGWRQAWVPCWLSPEAGEHLVAGGVRLDSGCTLNCCKFNGPALTRWPESRLQPGQWGPLAQERS